MSQMNEKSAQLVRYLQSRHLPMESEELKHKTQQIRQRLVEHGECTWIHKHKYSLTYWGEFGW